MAKKRKVKKKKIGFNFSNLINSFKSDRGSFIIGICLLFVAFFMMLGIVSFFLTGAADQAKVYNKGFFELISQKQEIDNWMGVGGAFIGENFVNGFFGIFSLVIPLFIGTVGLKLMKVYNGSLIRSFLLLSFVLIWGSITSSFFLTKFFPDSHIVWGGSHGTEIEGILSSALGWPGVLLIIILVFVILLVITKKASVEFFRNLFQNPMKKTSTEDESEFEDEEEEFDEDEEIVEEQPKKSSLFGFFKKKEKPLDNLESEEESTKDKIKDILGPEIFTKPNSVRDAVDENLRNDTSLVEDDFEVVVPKEEEYVAGVAPVSSAEDSEDVLDEVVDGDQEELEDYDPTKDLSSFAFPSMELLKAYDYKGIGVDMEEQKLNKEKIITTLRNYGIEITSIKATVGPTITLYEIVPQAGVRISKIRNLEDDIALSLAALGIRIIAPMPGKGTIGIEVPNKDPQIVSMQSVIASKKFQECAYDLPVALGKTITNDIFMFDLCKMPHLLVAGATGQGKSVGLNAIITSLLYKKHPAEMKMVLVDPKMVEFNIYSTIEKHYLAKLPDEEKAIITDVTKVTQTLNSLTKEMDDRYELLMNAGVRNIKEYNERFRKRRLSPVKGHRFLPYIVVIIDEFGDLIMTAGKEIEMPIARIAQKARAIGIHMIIATQRPTTNIITGTIKANFPARMAFRVTSQIDSRTILDMSGANQLIGRGDMLFSQGSDLIRIQCAFVDTPEVEGITQFIGNQRGYSNAFELPEFVGVEGSDDRIGTVDLNDKDALFEEAARLIVVHQQGSTSLIQRKFSIGYNRAGRLMDQLEAAGIVGPAQGSKPRDVYIADEYSLEQLLNEVNK